MNRLEKVFYTLGIGFGLWLAAVGATHFYISSVMGWWGDVQTLVELSSSSKVK